MSRTVTCTVWHPYPTYRWEYKTAQMSEWADVQDYALYESGYDTKTLHLKEDAVEADTARVRCAIYNPTGTVTYSDEVPITVGALAWEQNLEAGVTKTVEETVAANVFLHDFTSSTDITGWEYSRLNETTGSLSDKTVQAVAEDTPAYREAESFSDGAFAGGSKGLIIENGMWNRVRCDYADTGTFNADGVIPATAAVHGGLSGLDITEASGTSAHTIRPTSTASQPGLRSFSVYLKRGTRRYVNIAMYVGSDSAWATIDTETWDVTQTHSLNSFTIIDAYSTEFIDPDCLRWVVVAEHSGSTTYASVASTDGPSNTTSWRPAIPSVAGVAFSIYGLQVEEKGSATAYMPSVASDAAHKRPVALRYDLAQSDLRDDVVNDFSFGLKVTTYQDYRHEAYTLGRFTSSTDASTGSELRLMISQTGALDVYVNTGSSESLVLSVEGVRPSQFISVEVRGYVTASGELGVTLPDLMPGWHTVAGVGVFENALKTVAFENSDVLGDPAGPGTIASVTLLDKAESQAVIDGWGAISTDGAVYIDPSAQSNGDGSEGAPYDSWSRVLLQDNGVYLMRRGTSEDLTSHISFAGKKNVTISNYGSGALPIIRKYEVSTDSSDWTLVSGQTEYWEYAYGNDVGEACLLGLGALRTVAKKVAFLDDSRPTYSQAATEYGQWTDGKFASGSPDGNTKLLRIYSDINPVDKWGAIYYGVSGLSGISAHNNAGGSLIDGIRVEDSMFGVNISNFTTGGDAGKVPFVEPPIIRNCEFDYCYNGVYASGTGAGSSVFQVPVGANIHSNLFNNIYKYAVAFNGRVLGARAHHNNVLEWGQQESSGAIYMIHTATPSAPTHVYNNHVENGTWGNYWPDGVAFYSDYPCMYTEYRRNTALNLTGEMPEYASGPRGSSMFHDNGGREGFVVESNVCDNAWGFYVANDSGQFQRSDSYIQNNTAINLRYEGLIVRSDCRGEDSTRTIRNNICIASTSGDGGGFVDFWNWEGDMTSAESHNCLVGFATNDSRMSPTSTTVNPNLDGDLVPVAGGSADGTGDDSVLPLEDANGTPFTAPINRGAIES